MKNKYEHLKDIYINDIDKKWIIGTCNNRWRRLYQNQNMTATKTKLGSVIIFLGQGNFVKSWMFLKTSVHGYENLCSLDVLVFKDKHIRDDKMVYDEFQKQLARKKRAGTKKAEFGKKHIHA